MQNSAAYKSRELQLRGRIMMTWQDIVDSVGEAARQFSTLQDNLVFRGQSAESWKLVPWLGRLDSSSVDVGEDYHGNKMTYLQHLENVFYYSLQTQGGHLLPRNPKPWEILFLMRHYGFPTRLLDWSRSFGVALYFAIGRTFAQRHHPADENGAIWILHPGGLNAEASSSRRDIVYYLDTDFPIGYEKYFAHHLGKEYGTFPHPVVCTLADASNERLRAQRGVFTLHRDLSTPLEEMFPLCVQKVVIPNYLFPEARQFLALAGIDEASLFPDLSTLATFLIRHHIS